MRKLTIGGVSTRAPGGLQRSLADARELRRNPDLIFDICHHVTVLSLGKILAAGSPAEIRSHREVVNAYLGG